MKKEVILVCDDQKISRYSLKEILSSRYFVVEATNTKQAVNFIKYNSDVLNCIFSTETMDYKEIYKTKEFIKKEIGFCLSTFNNDPKIMAEAKSLGIDNFITRPYNEDMVNKLVTIMFDSLKESRFMHSDFLKQYNQMIEENIGLEQKNLGSCRIDFDKETMSHETGLIHEIYSKAEAPFSDIIEQLADKIIDGDKTEYMGTFSYINIRANFKKNSYLLEKCHLFNIEGRNVYVRTKVLNISNIENGPNKGLLVLLDETEQYQKNKINSELYKTHYELISLINLDSLYCTIDENNIEDFKIDEEDVVYEDFVHAILDKCFDQESSKGFEKKLNIKDVKESLEKTGSYDVSTVINKGKMTFYQFSFRYLDEYKDHVIFYVTDITDQQEYDSFTDALTYPGFLNKTYELVKNNETKFALLYCECTNYMEVCQYLELDTIVECLKQIYKIINVSFLNPYLIGRSVSDSFYVLANQEGVDFARLKELKTLDLKVENTPYKLTFKFGIYFIENVSDDLKSADVDLFCERAKVAGDTIGDDDENNYAEFDSSLKKEFTIKTTIANEIKTGEGKKDIEIRYQPIFDIKGKKIAFAEALVRWNHEELGLIGPNEFIPYLEANGGISEIDKAVIEKVDEFTEELSERGYGLPITVNLSRRDFFDNELVRMVKSISKKQLNERSSIAYEVTESFGVDISNNIAEILDELRANKAKILLDDFGDGLSSLKALASSHFDVIKIYKGLVDGIGMSKISEAAIKSTVQMCHAVGIKVIAEGVEVKEQLSFLKGCGVDYIQGYIFSKPISKEELLEKLKGK